MDGMSDEVRLQFVRVRTENLMLCIKMAVTVQTTLEAYRQYVMDELPEEFRELVGSEDFKGTFDQAIKASTEILQNLITLTDELGSIFNLDFRGQLPKTPEEFTKVAREIEEEITRKAKEEDFNWSINKQTE